MTQHTEGTVSLEGLIEGHLPPLPGSEDKLRQWVSTVRKLGLKFSLDTDGNRFSLLAVETPTSAEPLKPDPCESILNALNELMKIFPPEKRREVFSTLRSREYRQGVEVQTLYFVTGEGRFDIRRREVETDTTAPEAPLPVKHRLLYGLAGLAVVAAILALSALVVPYGEIWERMTRSVKPVDVESMPVEASAFEVYFTVEKVEKLKRSRGVAIILKRTEAFPTTEEAMADLFANTRDAYPEALVVEALARGYVRAELTVDPDPTKDPVVVQQEVRIRKLRAKETLRIELPVSNRLVLKGIRLTY